MKRFFKPIEKDGSAKKAALTTTTDSSHREEDASEEPSNDDNNKREPLKFVTWNANSLLLRVKNNWNEFSEFVSSFDPDVIAIQVTISLTLSLFAYFDFFFLKWGDVCALISFSSKL